MAKDTQEATEEFYRRFADILRSAADALFLATSPKFEIKSVVDRSPHMESAGVVGIVGPELRAMFVVGVNRAEVRQAQAGLHEDWLGELANQLAGRVKNQLCRLGVLCNASPPMTLRGDRLSLATTGAEVRMSYGGPAAECQVWALLEVLGPLELKTVDEGQEPMSEGTAVFF